jgi:1-acyl-sn-glycerol-3-phosphate acyltransferase
MKEKIIRLKNIIRGPICGALTLGLIALNTLFWCSLLFFMAFLKFIIPQNSWRAFCSRILNGLAAGWVGVNNAIQNLTMNTRWVIHGMDSYNRGGWHLVISNHQSWSDIFVLQRIFFRKIPFLKFFIKKELIWFPIMGQAWWALDFPFMKRYSKALLEKKPHLKGKDIEITLKACEKFKEIPVSIMNFVEGTRFTPQKRDALQSPYINLLHPKAGGISYVLMAMGRQLDKILDVSIIYPDGPASFWSFLCGKIKTVVVKINAISVPEYLVGDYSQDEALRDKIQTWLNALWAEKDKILGAEKALTA